MPGCLVMSLFLSVALTVLVNVLIRLFHIADRHVAEQISSAIVSWFKERAGRGPTQTKTHLDGSSTSCAARFQGIYRQELCALVASKVERPVATMLSDHDPETVCLRNQKKPGETEPSPITRRTSRIPAVPEAL